MATEIERKFLIKDWWQLATGKRHRISQGYLSVDPDRTVRVRVVSEEIPDEYENGAWNYTWSPTRAWITIKGRNDKATRTEYEFEIQDLLEAQNILENLCLSRLEKIRLTHRRPTGEIWEIDEFLGDNFGLVIAEIELESENQNIDLPDWIDTEITDDPRYYNSNLSVTPYKNWNNNGR